MTKKNWRSIHEGFDEYDYSNFPYKIYQQKWEEKGFNYQETKSWIEIGGLVPAEFEFAYYLKQNNYTSQTAFQEKSYAQVWLDWQYPNEGICIRRSCDKNYGKTRNQITYLNISQKKLRGSLNLGNFFNLEELNCSNNQLTNLDLSDCVNLRKLCCFYNKLNDLRFLNSSNEKMLKTLDIDKNNFSESNLTPISRFVNLEYLDLSNNNFISTLESLAKLDKLKDLGINNTNIDSGLECLPDSVEEFRCSVNWEKDFKVKAICNLFSNEQERIETEKKWYESEYIKNFPQKLQDYKKWRRLGFSNEEIQQWISAGAKWDEYEFVKWLRDTKNLGLEWIINYKEDYQVLSEKFKKYGLCSECNQPNTGDQWCKDCNSKHLQENFTKWTSHNSQIDEFIQKYQLQATDADKFIEWIPYEQFKDIEYLAQGGFGKVYKAKWTKGNVHYWDTEKNKWHRKKDHYYEEKDEYKLNKKHRNYREVALKSLNNSSTNTDFLQETEKHKTIDDWFNNIVPCYGLSQNPESGNHLMVMKYIERGDLRNYLENENSNFQDKLQRLVNIAQGMKDIHAKKLIHRDFHSGNILNDDIHSFIADLGLCKPANEASKEKNIYGVLPYIAPEVLRNKKYTLASDIYSFGIVAYEIFSEIPPYHDLAHEENLAIKICQGLRPDSDSIQVPQLLKDLIERCWDADPLKRPIANRLSKTLNDWLKKDEDIEFKKQLQTTEEFNKITEAKKTCELLSELYKRYEGQAKEIKVEEIKKAKGEIFSKFYNKHKYGKDISEVRKEFERLFLKVGKLNYKIHPSAVYTSRLLDFKNLPEPQNSKEINEQFYKLKETGDLDSLRVDKSSAKNSDTQISSEVISKENQTILVSESEEFVPIEIKSEQLQNFCVDNWQNLHPNFASELIQSWKNLNFTYSQTQDWLKIGLTPNDYNFANFLKNQKNLTPEKVLNEYNFAELKREFERNNQQAQIIQTNLPNWQNK